MNSLYQEQLLVLARSVREVAPLEAAQLFAHQNNPTCGDKISLSVCHENGVLTQCHIKVEGCALCAAGAGLWYQLSPQTSAAQLRQLSADVSAYLQGGGGDMNAESEANTALAVLAPIIDIKNRHRCVLLAFDAAIDLADQLDSLKI